MDQLKACLLFGDNNKRIWHMTDQTLENRSVNSFNRYMYNLMKNEGWARVRNVCQCCDFTVIFRGGTLGGGGGGTPDLIHAYVRWGCH